MVDADRLAEAVEKVKCFDIVFSIGFCAFPD